MEQESSKAQEQLVETKKIKKNDDVFLSNLQADCQAKAVEWEVRLKDANAETAAINKAIEILDAVPASSFQQSSVDTSFLQISLSAKSRMKARQTFGESFNDEE